MPAATATENSTASSPLQVVRETIESLAVAFVLALLFKGFIAEAFVIPTGSMAPTLMGAHKDIQCEECGYQYQCGASNEFNDVGASTKINVVGTTCPLCRKPQVANPKANSNQATFSGDRILVSKLAYSLSKPRRWDVIVFKFIQDARLNYIKRCIGLPNEIIRIREGNIFVQPKSSEQQPAPYKIARKPPQVMNAMLQVLYDSKYVPKSLIKAGLPNPWQPFPAKASSWNIQQSDSSWGASISDVPEGVTHWMRYYHRVVEPTLWEFIRKNGTFPTAISPQSSRLITDFTAYNASYFVDPGTGTNSKIKDDQFNESVQDFILDSNQNFPHSRPLENDGTHWTGDLATDIEFKTKQNTQAISIILVESGVEHECTIDLRTGVATASVLVDGKTVDAFESENGGLVNHASVQTSVRSGARHRLRFANVDDTLTLWVDGNNVRWSPSGNLLSEKYLPIHERVPKTSESNPLDAAPIAIGIRGGSAEIFHAQVFRDIYYIAQGPINRGLTDYQDFQTALRQSSSAVNNTRYASDFHKSSVEALSRTMSMQAIQRNALLTNPTQWAQSPMSSERQTVEFSLEKDWYFPMGDNSAASFDARLWNQGHTPERLMIGRAVLVFWPHYWNAPVPFLPNVQRMGLIR